MGRDARPDPAFWQNRSVFVTGHTGFVGGWLALWLTKMGARVHGYSLQPSTAPNFFESANLSALVSSTLADIRAVMPLRSAIAAAKPHVLFHLAAQPLVGPSFSDPIETFAVNVSGTMNVLAAITDTPSLKGAVIVTTDKVYADSDVPTRHREDDALGGQSPYSLSKAGAEFAVAAFRNSTLMRNDLGLATARAGNMIGGGDWGQDRLVPDAIKAFHSCKPVSLRMPNAVRPSQHVLDAVCGLLILAQRACNDPVTASGAWNFGPTNPATHTVEDVIKQLARLWDDNAAYDFASLNRISESPHLQIDSRKAVQTLGWQTGWPLDVAIRETVMWYQAFYREVDMRAFSTVQIDRYQSSFEPEARPVPGGQPRQAPRATTS